MCELEWKMCLKLLKMEPCFESLQTRPKGNTASEAFVEMKMLFIDP